MFSSLKYGFVFLLYLIPVRGYDTSYDSSCYNSIYGGCQWSQYPHLERLQETAMQYRNMEDVVRFIAQANVRDVCGDLVSWKKCSHDRATSASEQCKEQYSYTIERLTKEMEFVNYICIQQLNKLVANQKCFADYDLIAEIACCGAKIYHSSSCSEQKMLACAQQKIKDSKKCRSESGQLFVNIVTRFRTTIISGMTSDICPNAPASPHSPRGPQFFSQFF